MWCFCLLCTSDPSSPGSQAERGGYTSTSNLIRENVINALFYLAFHKLLMTIFPVLGWHLLFKIQAFLPCSQSTLNPASNRKGQKWTLRILRKRVFTVQTLWVPKRGRYLRRSFFQVCFKALSITDAGMVHVVPFPSWSVISTNRTLSLPHFFVSRISIYNLWIFKIHTRDINCACHWKLAFGTWCYFPHSSRLNFLLTM